MVKKVFCVLLSVLILFSVSGCGKIAKTPEEAISKSVEALQKGDLDALGLYLTNSEINAMAPMGHLLPHILSNMTYQVTSVQNDGIKAIVSISATNKDLSVVNSLFTAGILNKVYEYSQLPAEATPSAEKWEQIYAEVLSQVVASDIADQTYHANINLVLEGKAWKVQQPEDFFSLFLGNSIAAFNNLSNQVVVSGGEEENSDKPEPTTDPAPDLGPAVLVSKGPVGDYYVNIKTAEVLTDSNNNYIAVVFFEWANNSGKPQAPAYCINVDAAQAGKALKEARHVSEDFPADMLWKKYDNGTNTELQKAFVLEYDDQPIDIQITPAFAEAAPTVVQAQLPIMIK